MEVMFQFNSLLLCGKQQTNTVNMQTIYVKLSLGEVLTATQWMLSIEVVVVAPQINFLAGMAAFPVITTLVYQEEHACYTLEFIKR